SIVLRTILPAGLEVKRRAALPALPHANRELAGLTLSDLQQQALRKLEGSPGTAVLQGETGSGKTLLYRELIRNQLEAGNSALLLVPEIGLTPQALSDYRDLSEHI